MIFPKQWIVYSIIALRAFHMSVSPCLAGKAYTFLMGAVKRLWWKGYCAFNSATLSLASTTSGRLGPAYPNPEKDKIKTSRKRS
jgi:hypothetical protein